MKRAISELKGLYQPNVELADSEVGVRVLVSDYDITKEGDSIRFTNSVLSKFRELIVQMDLLELDEIEFEISQQKRLFEEKPCTMEGDGMLYSSTFGYHVLFDYTIYKDFFRSENELGQYLWEVYFSKLFPIEKELHALVRKRRDQLQKGIITSGERISREKPRRKVVKGNWIGHANKYQDNVDCLRNGLRGLIEPKFVRKFYDLLNSNKVDKPVHWLGKAKELNALIKGLSENDKFRSKQAYAYFKDTIVYEGENNDKKNVDTAFRKHTYDSDDPRCSKLYRLGKSLD